EMVARCALPTLSLDGAQRYAQVVVGTNTVRRSATAARARFSAAGSAPASPRARPRVNRRAASRQVRTAPQPTLRVRPPARRAHPREHRVTMVVSGLAPTAVDDVVRPRADRQSSAAAIAGARARRD